MLRSKIAALVTIGLLAAACGGRSTASVTASPTTTGSAGGDSVAPVTAAPATSTAVTTTTTIICDFAGPPLGIDGLATSPERPSVADHVSAVSVDRSHGCGHVVVKLGTDFSYDTPGPDAATVPGGVTVSVVDNTLRAVVSGIENVDINSVDPDVGDGSILARRSSSQRDLEIVVFPDGAFSDFSARFMKRPARIVIDFSERPLTSDEVAVPLADGDVIIESITTSATDPELPAGSATIVGFARPFEAQMEAEVLNQQGDAVPVVCSDGCYNGDIAATRLGVPTTDWAEAWGEFEITLTDLLPGSYTARFSNDAGAVDSASWVELPLVIRP